VYIDKCTKVEYIVSFLGSSPRALPVKEEEYVITIFISTMLYCSVEARLIKNLSALVGVLKGKKCVRKLTSCSCTTYVYLVVTILTYF
jgi:hypothetical protein